MKCIRKATKSQQIHHFLHNVLIYQTTVTRNVHILKTSGFVNVTKDKNDSRPLSVSITDKGLARLEEASPIWSQMQEKIENGVGKEKYDNLLEMHNTLQKSIGNER